MASNSSSNISDSMWRIAELNQVRRERLTRINKGIITPAYAMKPQLLVKDSSTGKWSPEIIGVN